MPDTIGQAYVGIAPDLSGFASQLSAGLTRALGDIKLGQLSLPGLETAAERVLVPSITRNVRQGLVTGLQQGTQEWLPGFNESTSRVARQLALPLSEGLQSGVSIGTQLALPGFESSFRERFRSLAGGWARSLVDSVDGAGGTIETHLGGNLRRALSGVGSYIANGITSGAGAIGNAIESTVGTAGRTVALAVGAVIAAGVTAGFTAGAQLDRLRASFIALTGSATEAQTIIASLRATTIKTGQDFSLLAQSTQQLITAGFNPKLATDVLNTVAQMVTVYGRGVQGLQRASIQLQEIGFRGTIQAQQLNALIRDGVPAYEALTVAAEHLGLAQAGSADATTKAKEAMKGGQITAEAFFAALSDPAVVGKVAATMEAIQTNVVFQLNQLRTITIHILGQITEPIQRVFGKALEPVTQQFDRLANNSDLLAGIGSKIATAFEPMVPVLSRVAAGVSQVVTALSQPSGLSQFANALQPLLPLLAGLGGLFASLSLSAAGTLPLLGAFVPELGPLVGIFVGLAVVSPAVRSSLEGVVAGLVPLGRALTPVLAQAAQSLSGTLGALAVTARPLGAILSQVLLRAVQQLGPAFLAVLNAAGPVAVALAQVGVAVLQALLPGLGQVVVVIAKTATSLAQQLGPVLVQIVLALQPLVVALAQLVVAFAPLIAAALPLAVPLLRLVAQGILLLAEGISQAAPLVSALAGVVSTVATELSRLIGWFAQNEAAARALGVVLAVVVGPALFNYVTLLGIQAAQATANFAVSVGAATVALARQAVAFEVNNAQLALFLVKLIAVRAAQIAMAVAEGIATIATWLWTAAQVALDVAMWANPIGLIVLAIVVLIGAIVLLVTHWSQVVQIAQTLWGKLQQLASFLGGAFMAAWAQIGPRILGFLSGLVSGAEHAWSEFARRPLYWVGFLIGFVVTKFNALVGQIANFLQQIVTNIGTWTTNLTQAGLTAAINFVTGILTWLSQLPGNVWNWLVSVVNAAQNFATWFPTFALTAATNFINWLASELPSLPGRVWSWLSGVISSAIRFASDFAPKALDAASQFASNLLNELGKLPGQTLDIGRRVAQGVIDGFMGMLGNAQTAIGNFVKGLIDGAHAAGQKGSPYRLFAREVGRPIAEGVALGITQNTDIAQQALGDLVGVLGSFAFDGMGRLVSQGAVLPQLAASVSRPAAPITVNNYITHPGANADQITASMGWKLSQMGVA